MSNLKQRQFQRTLRNQSTDSALRKRSLIIGSIIATVIAATPFMFYLYESVPETKVWDTFLFTFESHFYENANQAMWLITTKAIPLLLLFLWFFTCRHWWYVCPALYMVAARSKWSLPSTFLRMDNASS